MTPFVEERESFFFIDKYNGDDDDPIRTTVGQLNFFRWAINNNILEYIYKNYESIENDMNTFSKKNKKNITKTEKPDSSVNSDTNIKLKTKIKKGKTRKTGKSSKNATNSSFVVSQNNTNTDLTLSATKKVNKHNITITVKFN